MKFSISLACFLLACVVQVWVARDPVVHVLVQFPLLIATGYLLPKSLHLNASTIGPTLVLAVFAAAVWMLPRSLDAALESNTWHIAKFITLPLAIGVPLSLTWPMIGPVLRGFLKAQFISMMLFLSFLYTHAPIRICNSYLTGDQQRLGICFAFVAVGLTCWWIVPIFVGRPVNYTKDIRHGLSNFSH